MNEHGKLVEQKRNYRKLENDLEKLKKKYELALANFEGGILQVRYFFETGSTRVVYISDGHLKMIGYTRDEYEKLIIENRTEEMIYKDDRKQIVKNIKERLEGKEKKLTYYRLYTKQGKIKWVQCMSAVVEVDSNSALIQLHVEDITELKEIQHKLEIERAEFELFASITSFHLFRHNLLTDEIIYYEINNGKVEEVVEKSFLFQAIENGLIHKDDLDDFMKRWKKLQEEKEESVIIYRRKYDNNEYHWVQANVKFLTDENGKAISAVGRLTDIEEKKREEEYAKIRAGQDELTKLYNKTIFQEKCEKQLAQVEKGIFLLIDIDDFKILNDKYGHLFGDTVLVNVANSIASCIQSDCLLGRYGGDEFVLFMEVTSDSVNTIQLPEQIVARLRENNENSKVLQEVTVSIGISMYPEDGKDFSQLLITADFAMCQAKEHGKNRSETFSDYRDKYLSLPKESQRCWKLNSEYENTSMNLTEEIAEYSFEILEGVKDLESAISIIISNTGRYFDLTYVSLRWLDMDRRSLTLAHQWNGTSQIKKPHKITNFSMEEFNVYLNSFEKNGVLICQDKAGGGIIYEQNLFEKAGARLLLQCAVYERDEIVGILTFATDDSDRQWTNQEIRTLKLIGRVISAHITGKKTQDEIEEKVKWLTSYDTLTGLCTVDEFKRLGNRILHENQGKRKVGITYSDFTNFKTVNDTFGEETGDKILKEFADSITACKPTLVAARDYADNIVSIFCYESLEEVADIIQEMNRTFCEKQNKKYPGMDLNIASGVYGFAERERNVVTGIDNANIARKTVKREKKFGVLIFKPEMLREINLQMKILAEFNTAIQNQEFELYLQPQMNIQSGRIVGAEALVRWMRDEKVYRYPDEFIPILERTGVIVKLDYYMLEKILQRLKAWKNAGLELMHISVNFSRIHLYNADFGRNLYNKVKEYDIDPRYIDVEITESVFVKEYVRVVDNLDFLRKQGFTVSIDDFGKGYSSLKMLTEVAVDAIKIDKEFLAGAERSKVNRNIIEYMITLADELKLGVVCEGVETEEQLKMLRRTSCKIVQGYYYERPIPSKRFEQKYFDYNIR